MLARRPLPWAEARRLENRPHSWARDARPQEENLVLAPIGSLSLAGLLSPCSGKASLCCEPIQQPAASLCCDAG